MDSPFSPNRSHPSVATRLVSIEAGGTKFNVGIGGSDGVLHRQARFATRSPDETLGDLIEWLDAEIAKDGPISAIGMATVMRRSASIAMVRSTCATRIRSVLQT